MAQERGDPILIRMIPFDEKYDELMGRYLFGQDQLTLAWQEEEQHEVPQTLIDGIVTAMQDRKVGKLKHEDKTAVEKEVEGHFQEKTVEPTLPPASPSSPAPVASSVLAAPAASPAASLPVNAQSKLHVWLETIRLSHCASELMDLGIDKNDLSDLRYLQDDDLRKLTSLKKVIHFRRFMKEREKLLKSLQIP